MARPASSGASSGGRDKGSLPVVLLVGLVCFLLASWQAPASGLGATVTSSPASRAGSSRGLPPPIPLSEGLGPTRETTLDLRERTYGLFRHGWEAYMNSAFPSDELKPLSCTGLGPGPDQPGSVNDVCGNFSLTLIDVADTLAVMGDREGFEAAVRLIIDQVSFDQDVKVQVFEVLRRDLPVRRARKTIRVLGGLLSTHLLALSNHPTHPGFALDWYNSELLHLATDLADRLLPAFRTPTGIPLARINLRRGIAKGETVETCAAGAGSLLLEWIVLSRLTGVSLYEEVATKAFYAVWGRRSERSLIGNALNAFNGAWIPPLISHVGAGVDSFIEYAYKAYILTGEERFHDVFRDFYGGVMTFVRDDTGFWYRGVGLETGERVGLTVDSLAAFLPGLQTLAGDVESAIKAHLAYWNLWRRYGGIPESFHVVAKDSDNLEYPFRPEFVESTYYLYQATKDPFYLEVGEQILEDLETYGLVSSEDSEAGRGCGLAGWTLGDGTAGRMDRMESFALSETLKYLYLLFDQDPRDAHDWSSATVFSTEGHLLFIPPHLLRAPSPTRRALRKGENLQCPALETSVGLSLGIKGRTDWDYARHLAGLDLVEDDTDEALWRPDGWCSIAQAEKWTVEVMFSAGEAEEDLSPGKDKLRMVEGGAELRQTENIRARVTRRLDGAGYDVSHVGPYILRTGQTLWITDPSVVIPFHAAAATYAPPPLNETEERDRTVRLRLEVDGEPWRTITAGAATFGGVVSPMRDGVSRPAIHVGSPALGLVAPPATHQLACEPLPSSGVDDLRGSLLLVKRGGCTFARKLLSARQRGAVGIVVWDATPPSTVTLAGSGIIQPTASDADWADAAHPATEHEVVLYLPFSRGAGKKLDALLRRGGADVRVSLERTPQPVGGMAARSSASAHDDDRRRLWVGSLPVRNAVVGTAGHPDFASDSVT